MQYHQGVEENIFKEMAKIHNKYIEYKQNDSYSVDETPFSNIDKFLHRNKFSTSLIDKEHQATFAPVSIIIDSPADHIIDASHKDMLSDFEILNKIRKFFSSNLSKSSREILEKSSNERHNEVVISGNKASEHSVKVKGVLIKTLKDGTPTDIGTAKEAINFADKYNLPVVKINTGHTKREYKDLKKQEITKALAFREELKEKLSNLGTAKKIVQMCVFPIESFAIDLFNCIQGKPPAQNRYIKYMIEICDEKIKYFKNLLSSEELIV